MPPVGFEPTISEGERPQTYALDRAAIGTGNYIVTYFIYIGQHLPFVHLAKKKMCKYVLFKTRLLYPNSIGLPGLPELIVNAEEHKS